MKTRIMEYAVDTLLPPLGITDVRWADASGLSRYSLFTPRHITRLLLALQQEVGLERLRDLLPEGGGNGTLANRFDGAEEPYVWAKTGTLSGVTCLSGYVKTKTGRWLAFSFLHNNFVQSQPVLLRGDGAGIGLVLRRCGRVCWPSSRLLFFGIVVFWYCPRGGKQQCRHTRIPE